MESIRPLTSRDLPFALSLVEREGWAASPGVLEAILARDPAGSFLLERSGEGAAIVTTLTYARTAWVGHLIVREDLRQLGLGTRLMEHAMAHVQGRGVSCIRLEADPPGMSIYRRLGFEAEFTSLRFRTCAPPGPVAPSRPADLTPLARLDAESFGDDRSQYLALLGQRALASFAPDDRGYVMVLPTTTGAFIGPLVAREPAVARDLLARALSACPGRSVTIGIPEPNGSGVALLEEMGFEPRPASTRMSLGDGAGRGRVTAVFGIASGATG
jgi:GNAT superfamily N-acetyltransferase